MENKTKNIKENELEFLIQVEMIELELIKNLVKRRKEKKLTQKDIADRTGLSQQAISRIETYGFKPSLKNLMKYLYAIEININDLFI